MTAPAAPAGDAVLRPVPWQRMGWVTWRQHRFALGGVAVLLGGLALYLWLAGLGMHHAYAATAACPQAGSPACQAQLFNFTAAYGGTAQTVATLVMAIPALLGAFVGAPVLARELETGTFRFAWTLVGRRRWAVAKLVPLAVTLTAAAALFSLLFSWYYQPLFAAGDSIPLDPALFPLRGVAYAAWTLAAFAIGSLAGLLIRRVVPAIAASLAVYVGLMFATGLFLRQHYLAPLLGKNLASAPAAAWVVGGWWTKGATVISQSAMQQVMDPLFRRSLLASLPANTPESQVKYYKGTTVAQVNDYLFHHGYAQWTSYQPGSRFWPFQWIEGGWLLALSVLLLAATVWLVRRRAT